MVRVDIQKCDTLTLEVVDCFLNNVCDLVYAKKCTLFELSDRLAVVMYKKSTHVLSCTLSNFFNIYSKQSFANDTQSVLRFLSVIQSDRPIAFQGWVLNENKLNSG